ncbi:MAG: c-type cytochrome domain-containing protein, partial [Verrucomicrobiota bacterium]
MRRRIVSVLLGVALAQVGFATGFAKKDKGEISKREFERDIKPLLGKYCYSCHGEMKKKADLSLQAYENLASVMTNRPVWERVLHNVQTREMPPENKPPPTEKERSLIT